MSGGPGWSVSFSADCPHIAGQGYRCMVCALVATGHAAVEGGPHSGRFFAIVCPRHASAEGWPEVKERMVTWMAEGLLSLLGGPGPDGAPEVWHLTDPWLGHYDPLPTHSHEEAQ